MKHDNFMEKSIKSVGTLVAVFILLPTFANGADDYVQQRQR